jgi:hypothetical protein
MRVQTKLIDQMSYQGDVGLYLVLSMGGGQFNLQNLCLFPIYCGVFTPCKNCNIETRSHDYATVDEALFSPCRAER